MKDRLELIPQLPPIDHPNSCNRFRPGPHKLFVTTRGAIDRFSQETVVACLRILQEKAEEHDGIAYLQVFESADGDQLWFIEDGGGSVIIALLPGEY